MAASTIGSLRINLGLDSAQFQSGLNKSQTGMQKFAKAAAIGFAAASAAAVGAFMAIQGAAQRADEQIKASQSYGVPIEELGRLAYAAELSGSSMQEVGKAAQRASRAVNDSMNGIENAGTEAFHQLEVALQNAGGSARSADEILGDVAEKFANMPDGAQKTALAIEMFGRSGANLIPMLNQGREGLAAMGDEAERLGLVFDQQTAMAAERFNDNLTRLSSTMTGLWNQVLANVIGGFAQLTDKIVIATQEGGGLQTAVGFISGAMNLLVRAVTLVVDNIEFLIDVMRTFIAIKIVLFLGSAAGAMLQFARTVRTLGAVMLAVTTITRAKMTAILLLGAAIAQVTGTTQVLVGWIENLGSTIYNALPESLRGGIDGMRDSLGGLLGDIESADADGNRAFGNLVAGANMAADSVGRVGSAASRTADQVDVASSAMEKMGDIGEQVTSKLADTFTDMFVAVLDGGKNIGDMIGSLLKDLGRMFLNQGFQALFGMMSGGLGGGGGLFAGIGKLFGFAKGGTIMPGGSGGIDSQLVAFRKSPNERVDITKPGQTLTAGGGRMGLDVSVSVDEQGNLVPMIRKISGEGDVRVVKSIERGMPGMLAEAQMRQG